MQSTATAPYLAIVQVAKAANHALLSDASSIEQHSGIEQRMHA
jgi:hypothetical protein